MRVSRISRVIRGIVRAVVGFARRHDGDATGVMILTAMMTAVGCDVDDRRGWFAPGYDAASRTVESADAELRRLAATGYPIRPIATTGRFGSQSRLFAETPSSAPTLSVRFGQLAAIDRIVIVPACVSPGSAHALPRRMTVALTAGRGRAVWSRQVVPTPVHFDDGLPIIVDVVTSDPLADGPVIARGLTITADELSTIAGRPAWALSEVMAIGDGVNHAAGGRVLASDTPALPPLWHRDYVTDGVTSLDTACVRDLSDTPDLADVIVTIDPNTDPEDLGSPGGDLGSLNVDLGERQSFDRVRLYPIELTRTASIRGYGFPRGFRVEVADDAKFVNPRIIARVDGDGPTATVPPEQPVVITHRWASRLNVIGRGRLDPQRMNRVDADDPPIEGRYVRVVATRTAVHEPIRWGLAEIEILRGADNLAAGRPAWSVVPRAGSKRRDAPGLTDGRDGVGRLVSTSHWIDHWRHVTDVRQTLRTAVTDRDRAAAIADRRAAVAGWVGSWASIAAVSLVVWGWRTRRRRQRRRFREAVAADLHDEIGTGLAAIARTGEVAMLTAGGKTDADPDAARHWTRVTDVATRCGVAMNEVLDRIDGGSDRTVAGVTRSDRPMHRSDVASVLRGVTRRTLGRLPADWVCDLSPKTGHDGAGISAETVRELRLAYQECLTNVLRHGDTDDVRVRIWNDDQTMRVSVSHPAAGRPRPLWRGGGRGLNNIRRRMSRIGGGVRLNEPWPPGGRRGSDTAADADTVPDTDTVLATDIDRDADSPITPRRNIELWF